MLRAQIGQTQQWSDLRQIVERVDASCACGEIAKEEAQALATAISRRARVLPADGEHQRLSTLFWEKPVHRVTSRTLGKDILWVADGAQIPPENDLVVYRESELKELAGRGEEELRAIHKVKKALDGEVLTEDNHVSTM